MQLIFIEIIFGFIMVSLVKEMLCVEMCFECYIKCFVMMQSSVYLYYSDMYKEDFEYVYKICGKIGFIDVLFFFVFEFEQFMFCVFEIYYIIIFDGEICEQVVYFKNVLIVVFYYMNQEIFDCLDIFLGKKLCLFLFCGQIVLFFKNDICMGFEEEYKFFLGDICCFNLWIIFDCGNFNGVFEFFGNVFCVVLQNGQYIYDGLGEGGDILILYLEIGYILNLVDFFEGLIVVFGIMMKCGKWYVVEDDDICVIVCLGGLIDIVLFFVMNLLLGKDYVKCIFGLVKGNVYCIGLNYDW